MLTTIMAPATTIRATIVKVALLPVTMMMTMNTLTCTYLLHECIYSITWFSSVYNGFRTTWTVRTRIALIATGHKAVNVDFHKKLSSLTQAWITRAQQTVFRTLIAITLKHRGHNQNDE